MSLITEALADVDRAFNHLEFAIRVMCYCELGHVDLSSFDADVAIILPKGNLGFDSGRFSKPEALVPPAQAQVGVVFGVTAIVLDAAFDLAGRKNQPNSRDPADELRTIVRMVRNAFAHNPAMPVWVVRGPDYQRQLSFSIHGAALSIDLATLHGVAFDYEHVGGMPNWLRIRAAALTLLQTAQQGHAADRPQAAGG